MFICRFFVALRYYLRKQVSLFEVRIQQISTTYVIARYEAISSCRATTPATCPDEIASYLAMIYFFIFFISLTTF